jgi:hypothetical protein
MCGAKRQYANSHDHHGRLCAIQVLAWRFMWDMKCFARYSTFSYYSNFPLGLFEKITGATDVPLVFSSKLLYWQVMLCRVLEIIHLREGVFSHLSRPQTFKHHFDVCPRQPEIFHASRNSFLPKKHHVSPHEMGMISRFHSYGNIRDECTPLARRSTHPIWLTQLELLV